MLTLYSNDCPRCKVLEQALKDANIEFEKSKDFKKVMSQGYRSAPVLELEYGTMMPFEIALVYIKNKGDN